MWSDNRVPCSRDRRRRRSRPRCARRSASSAALIGLRSRLLPVQTLYDECRWVRGRACGWCFLTCADGASSREDDLSIIVDRLGRSAASKRPSLAE
jgi:hypothetical protein